MDEHLAALLDRRLASRADGVALRIVQGAGALAARRLHCPTLRMGNNVLIPLRHV
jgi:hypothetical protein